MKFSKAIQIKQLVNRWNEERRSLGYGEVHFNCSMYSLGRWSVTLEPKGVRVFFSYELDELVTLYAGGGFRMYIGAVGIAPYIDMQ